MSHLHILSFNSLQLQVERTVVRMMMMMIMMMMMMMMINSVVTDEKQEAPTTQNKCNIFVEGQKFYVNK